MNNDKHVLIITDDENSDIVRMFLRHRIIPITRRSIISAIYLLRHLHIVAIIVDKELQNVDTLEFILNARDIAHEIPIFVPDTFNKKEDWADVKDQVNVLIYNDENMLIKNTVNKLVNL
jgi:hypothetical protein